MSDWARETALAEAMRDMDERREFVLAMADVRAAPDVTLDVLKMMFANGWRRGWDDRERHEMPTQPPPDEVG